MLGEIMMDYQALGQKVRFVRKQKNMTQEQLAEAVGISASFLGHIERGTRVASLETLVALCKTLNVGPEYLLGHELDGDIPPELREKASLLLECALALAKT